MYIYIMYIIYKYIYIYIYMYIYICLTSIKENFRLPVLIYRTTYTRFKLDTIRTFVRFVFAHEIFNCGTSQTEPCTVQHTITIHKEFKPSN